MVFARRFTGNDAHGRCDAGVRPQVATVRGCGIAREPRAHSGLTLRPGADAIAFAFGWNARENCAYMRWRSSCSRRRAPHGSTAVSGTRRGARSGSAKRRTQERRAAYLAGRKRATGRATQRLPSAERLRARRACGSARQRMTRAKRYWRRIASAFQRLPDRPRLWRGFQAYHIERTIATNVYLGMPASCAVSTVESHCDSSALQHPRPTLLVWSASRDAMRRTTI